MNGILQSLVGRRVVVFSGNSQSSYKDEGVVRSVDATAIQMEVGGDNTRTDKPAAIYIFPISGIRLIRRVD